MKILLLMVILRPESLLNGCLLIPEMKSSTSRASAFNKLGEDNDYMELYLNNSKILTVRIYSVTFFK